MRDEVVGVGHAIALDVRAVRIFRIRPPVICFRKEVVQPTGAPWTGRGGDRDRLFREILIRRLEYPLAIEGGDFEFRLLR